MSRLYMIFHAQSGMSLPSIMALGMSMLGRPSSIREEVSAGSRVEEQVKGAPDARGRGSALELREAAVLSREQGCAERESLVLLREQACSEREAAVLRREAACAARLDSPTHDLLKLEERIMERLADIKACFDARQHCTLHGPPPD